MEHLKKALFTACFIAFAATLSAQSSHTITIRLMESQYKKWSKTIVVDKQETIEFIDVTPTHPDKINEPMISLTQVLDKYMAQGYRIVTSNGGTNAQQYISNY